jgi:ABC-type thiamine transport system ATPase subunit
MSGNNLYLKRGGENVATCMYKNNNVFASARAQTNIGMGLSSRPLLGGKIQLGRRI